MTWTGIEHTHRKFADDPKLEGVAEESGGCAHSKGP